MVGKPTMLLCYINYISDTKHQSQAEQIFNTSVVFLGNLTKYYSNFMYTACIHIVSKLSSFFIIQQI